MNFESQLKLRPDTVDDVAGWMWVKDDEGAWLGPSREWEETHRDAFLEYVKKKNVVVQAGGNCGLYPRLLSKYFKTVYTFEPDSLNFHCLVNNCQSANIIKINAALGEENKLIEIEQETTMNVGTFKISGSSTKAIIPQFTIDQLALNECDLIQLDVEGFECNVLRGAANTIAKFKPVIACEAYHWKDHSETIGDLLRPFGYEPVNRVGVDVIYVPF